MRARARGSGARRARVEEARRFATSGARRYSARMTAPVWLDEIVAALEPDRVSTRTADLDAASRDESSLPASRPDAVAWPLSTEEAAAIVRIAARSGIALTARGAGTSLEGNPIPVHGGIVVDFSRMTR